VGLEIPVFVHYFAKNVSVGKRGSFRKKKFSFLFFCGFFPEKGSGMESVELECKAPSFGIGVVFLEDVDTSDIFPEVDWFLNSLDVQKAEECRLAGS
jgi:hypothetical protein